MDGMNWQEYKKQRKNISSEEKIRVETNENLAKIISELFELRQNKKLSQRDIAQLTGLKQPAIARMETLESIPRLDTVIKVFSALGYDLKPVSKEENVQIATIVMDHNPSCSECAYFQTVQVALKLSTTKKLVSEE